MKRPEKRLTPPHATAPQSRQRPYWCWSVVAAFTTVSAKIGTAAFIHCADSITASALANGEALRARDASAAVEDTNRPRKIGLHVRLCDVV